MIRVAITGGIACGKSLVGTFLEDLGVDVCEADELARLALEPGMPAYGRVVEAFGAEILLPDGRIDRRHLGQIVFACAEARARLNGIVHPGVRRAWREWLESESRTGVAAVIVPLLYEIGEGTGWDAVICVSTTKRLQMERLTARGLSASEAANRMRAQWPIRHKTVLADHVIVNNGGIDLVREQVARVMATVRAM